MKKYTSEDGDHSLTVEDKNYVYYYDNGRDLRKFKFSIYIQFTSQELLKIFHVTTKNPNDKHLFSKFLQRHNILLEETDPY